MNSLTTDTEQKIDEFLPTLTLIFTGAKWFGIPVYGGKKFICLTVLILLMFLSIEVTAIWELIRSVAAHAVLPSEEHSLTARLSGTIFYGNTLLSLILLWRFIRTWKSLSTYWLNIESKGLNLPPDFNIRKRMFLSTFFLMMSGFVEHACSMVSAIGFDCPPSEYLSRYILNSHKFMLKSKDYNLWLGIFIFIASKIATILWNFQDLTVILISMGLTSRYHRLNLYVKRMVTSEKRYRKQCQNTYTLLPLISSWRKLRQAYVEQAKLVRKIDEKLGALVILCNVNNLYFICLQLFLELRKSEGAIISRAYYFVSLGCLTFRASSVVLVAADVNLHSQKALSDVCVCPSSGYNIEIKRLKYFLIHNHVCLTGLGLFQLNRNKLLMVAATIVKYLLILINYDT